MYLLHAEHSSCHYQKTSIGFQKRTDSIFCVKYRAKEKQKLYFVYLLKYATHLFLNSQMKVTAFYAHVVKNHSLD